MENMLKESAAANERQMCMMRDFMHMTLSGKDAQRQRDKEKQARLYERHDQHKERGECNIL